MREEAVILEYLSKRVFEGQPVVVATICRVWGSSSRPVGSRMVISADGEFIGSVSGGCVEGDVARRAQEVLRDHVPRSLAYGPVSDPLLQVGLNCDGRIEVILEYADAGLVEHLAPPVGQAAITRYRHADAEGRVDAVHFWEPVNHDAPEEPWYRPVIEEGTEWGELVEPRTPKPLLLIVSAGPPAAPLSAFGREMGYRVVVSDPREIYARQELFPAAHEVVCCWPRDLPEVVGVGPGGIGSRCAVVSLNHEPRFEDDLFRMLMTQPAVGYLGAMGKRQRHAERLARQHQEQFDVARLPRMHTPIGLDIGGKEPADIALAIIAEIRAVRHGAAGGFLADQGTSPRTLYSSYTVD
ncbi:MAG TPA: XdhC family protein [Alkalispirochaeta sp.]|nr:XdhC family protein [Alkalispirochaeta sp.]